MVKLEDPTTAQRVLGFIEQVENPGEYAFLAVGQDDRTVSFWEFDEDLESIEMISSQTLESKVKNFVQINDFSNV